MGKPFFEQYLYPQAEIKVSFQRFCGSRHHLHNITKYRVYLQS